MAEKGAFTFTTSIQRKILAVLWQDVASYNIYRECIKPKYFTKAIEMDICRILFDFWSKYGTPPTQAVMVEEVLTMIEKTKSKQKLESEYLKVIEEIATMDVYDYQYVKDKIIDFGKKQAMIEAIMESADIIEKGNTEDFTKVTKLIEAAQMVGEDLNDLGVEYWDNYEQRLESYTMDEDVIERFPTGMDALDIVLKGGLGRTEMGVILAPPGRGKALHPDTPVLTPDGYVPMKSLNIGDYVISVDGTRTKVTNVFHHQNKHMYKVTMLDGGSVVCCDEHLWSVQNKWDRDAHRTTYHTIPLKDMLSDFRMEDGTRCKYSIPIMTNPCELNPHGELPVDPWLLGAFIGDGCSSGNFNFNNTEEDVIEKFASKLPDTMYLKLNQNGGCEHSIQVKPEYKPHTYGNQKSEFRVQLEELGLYQKKSYDKFIPKQYLFADVVSRIEMLRGLLDTDGWVKSKTSIVFSTSSEQLAQDVKFLADSLGIIANVSPKVGAYTKTGEKVETRVSYDVYLKPVNGIIPVSSKKHLGKLSIKPCERRFISNIEYVGDSEAICITVEHESELYVVKDSIVTHNTTFMINCGANALRLGKNVVHISLENNDKQITRNYDLRMLGKNMEYIQSNLEKCYKALGFAKRYGNGSLFVKKYPTKKASVDNIRMYLNKLIAVKGIQIDMIIIDYGAILKPMTSWNDKRNTIESNYEDMRALADEYNAALWTGAQGNRMSLSKKIVTMEDLAEAFAIANTSDVMVALCQTIREKSDGVIRAFLTKNRDGMDSVLLRGNIDYEAKKITLTEDITHSMVTKDDDDEEDDDSGDWKDEGRRSKRDNK